MGGDTYLFLGLFLLIITMPLGYLYYFLIGELVKSLGYVKFAIVVAGYLVFFALSIQLLERGYLLYFFLSHYVVYFFGVFLFRKRLFDILRNTFRKKSG